MCGDLIIFNTVPPHMAVTISETMAICEDGTVLSLKTLHLEGLGALDILKSLESEVLRRHVTG